ncbi:MAG: class I SAM-dependent methyltransferase [Candidatus Dojkabacteria bacterium]|jgi:ubiquinone/menaquinone biosynthesis C-methylase UbiE
MNIEEYAKKHPKFKGATLSPLILEKIEKLPKGSKILDIGCAEGFTIKELFDIFGKKYEYTGVDLSETRIEKAKELKLPNTEFIVSTGEDMPLKNNTFDCVLSSQVLEHVEDENAFLSEINRVLKLGGIFEIDTVFKKKWAWYFYRSPMGWALDPTHLREYADISVLEELFKKTNLKIEEIHLVQAKRDLGKILPVKITLPILGYYTIYILGKK